ncbi:hypothetical protein BJ508DRAFT_301159 [Ascobolus immersus RN42]|uniref:Uncharacterized protein n=1 Tax=Ascobolus immersus RN42 TaxID=1160509 RepID=A0A3N4INL7_ASCIM|nr:hypothetical protein BJ508DRAFT_301159 [Ascobolus immersus RN42]
MVTGNSPLPVVPASSHTPSNSPPCLSPSLSLPHSDEIEDNSILHLESPSPSRIIDTDSYMPQLTSSPVPEEATGRESKPNEPLFGQHPSGAPTREIPQTPSDISIVTIPTIIRAVNTTNFPSSPPPECFPRSTIDPDSQFFDPTLRWKPSTVEQAKSIEKVYGEHLMVEEPDVEVCNKCETRRSSHEGSLCGIFLEGDRSKTTEGKLGRPREMDWVVIRHGITSNLETGFVFELLNDNGEPTNIMVGWVAGTAGNFKVAKLLAARHVVIAQVQTIHETIYHQLSERNLVFTLHFTAAHFVNDYRDELKGPFKLCFEPTTGRLSFLKRKRADTTSTTVETSDPYLPYDLQPENRHILHVEDLQKRERERERERNRRAAKRRQLHDEVSNGIKNEERWYEREILEIFPEVVDAVAGFTTQTPQTPKPNPARTGVVSSSSPVHYSSDSAPSEPPAEGTLLSYLSAETLAATAPHAAGSQMFASSRSNTTVATSEMPSSTEPIRHRIADFVLERMSNAHVWPPSITSATDNNAVVANGSSVPSDADDADTDEVGELSAGEVKEAQ